MAGGSGFDVAPSALADHAADVERIAAAIEVTGQDCGGAPGPDAFSPTGRELSAAFGSVGASIAGALQDAGADLLDRAAALRAAGAMFADFDRTAALALNSLDRPGGQA